MRLGRRLVACLGCRERVLWASCRCRLVWQFQLKTGDNRLKTHSPAIQFHPSRAPVAAACCNRRMTPKLVWPVQMPWLTRSANPDEPPHSLTQIHHRNSPRPPIWDADQGARGLTTEAYLRTPQGGKRRSDAEMRPKRGIAVDLPHPASHCRFVAQTFRQQQVDDAASAAVVTGDNFGH